MRDLLVVTNDFPPRQGGIQSFVHELVRRLPADRVAVYCSDFAGAAAFDAQQSFPVRRHPTGLLIPTPAAARRIADTVADLGSTRVWYGASAPLGLLASTLSRRGIRRQVATTHGHEVGWAMLPGARQALRRIGNTVDVVTYLGEYTRHRLAPAFGSHPLMAQLTPGVDTEFFAPEADGRAIRERYALTDAKVIVCVSRLVPRKGQDALIRALPLVRRTIPNATLLIVGRGPDEQRLRRLARDERVEDHVVFTGGVPYAELPAHFAAGQVFAMPCRTRRFGMDVEGLGIVFLEASAVGLPVLAGDSGGAPDAVVAGSTGEVLDGRDVRALADALAGLLGEPDRARRYGQAGRRWVTERWQWDQIADRLAELLQL
ncbi:glycosyltransferase family 4 protein [Jatrophihabitans telluris]|uniref:Glycosyltransferase family 4 protein n=1 Tax=Jatrophihabitans telluris TaxID=2038343 RepID=A0ABY4QW69_9ACTN|nr:glycosyltransferase family 4 protein [Jatrophihabitans telluris]UQX87240.1 glycosyltransferase family 4 protein [Jatrophihabitans telluris]